MKIQVRLFGAFSGCGDGGRLEVEIGEGARVGELRALLRDDPRLQGRDVRPGLLRHCAFADERSLLRDADPLPADGRIAVLPPVSGG